MSSARASTSHSIRRAAGMVGATLFIWILIVIGLATHAEARGVGETAGLAPPQVTLVAPTNLVATVVQDRLTIALRWDDNVIGEPTWLVERSVTGPLGLWVIIANLPANTAQLDDTGLEDGVTYWYRIFATVNAFPPIYSNVASGTASDLPMPPVGDADCDGSVTSIDSALVLQFGAGLLAALDCATQSDSNQDGVVDARDALLILQFIASLVSQLPPPSGISGLVTIGPVCPVKQEDMPCPAAPFASKLRILDDTGRLVRSVASDGDGTFQTVLPPGSYVLQPYVAFPSRPPFADEQTVVIEPFAFTDVLVQYDSGIR